MKLTTKGLLAMVVCAMFGLGAGAMYVKHQDDKASAVSSDTVVSPPTVEVVDPFIEEARQVIEETEALINTPVTE